MERKWRVGIVGCGGIAGVHIWALQQLENCEITALCDPVPGKAEKLAAKAGLQSCKIYGSMDELLTEGAADVLHLCTPHHLHVPMAEEGLKKGLSVFLEKPAALSVRELERLQETEQAAKGRLGICFQNRYNVSTQKLDELVNSGAFGAVRGGRAFVTWRRDASYYEGSPWKGHPETEGGGVLMNQSIHTLDLLLRYLGEPERIEATMCNHHTADSVAVEDTVEAWLSFADGRRGCFYASNGYAADAPILLELECENGRLLLTGNTITVFQKETVNVIACKEPPGIGKGYWGSGHLSAIRDFYDCMEQDRKYANDLSSVRNTTRTVLEIYEKAGRK